MNSPPRGKRSLQSDAEAEYTDDTNDFTGGIIQDEDFSDSNSFLSPMRPPDPVTPKSEFHNFASNVLTPLSSDESSLMSFPASHINNPSSIPTSRDWSPFLRDTSATEDLPTIIPSSSWLASPKTSRWTRRQFQQEPSMPQTAHSFDGQRLTQLSDSLYSNDRALSRSTDSLYNDYPPRNAMQVDVGSPSHFLPHAGTPDRAASGRSASTTTDYPTPRTGSSGRRKKSAAPTAPANNPGLQILTSTTIAMSSDSSARYAEDQLRSPDLSLLMEAQRLSSASSTSNKHTNIFHQPNIGKFPNLGGAGSAGGGGLPPPEHVPMSPILGTTAPHRHFADIGSGGYAQGAKSTEKNSQKPKNGNGSGTIKEAGSRGSYKKKAKDMLIRNSLESFDSNSSSSSIGNINSLNSSMESMDRLLNTSESAGIDAMAQIAAHALANNPSPATIISHMHQATTEGEFASPAVVRASPSTGSTGSTSKRRGKEKSGTASANPTQLLHTAAGTSFLSKGLLLQSSVGPLTHVDTHSPLTSSNPLYMGMNPAQAHLSPNPNPNPNPNPVSKDVICNCKKTKCLKLYCDCFRISKYCDSSCKCSGCSNVALREDERQAAINQIRERNPDAFKPKVTAVGTPGAAGVTSGHLSGCHCKKSACLKKYCECFTENVACTGKCRCQGCENTKPGNNMNGKVIAITSTDAGASASTGGYGGRSMLQTNNSVLGTTMSTVLNSTAASTAVPCANVGGGSVVDGGSTGSTGSIEEMMAHTATSNDFKGASSSSAVVGMTVIEMPHSPGPSVPPPISLLSYDHKEDTDCPQAATTVSLPSSPPRSSVLDNGVLAPNTPATPAKSHTSPERAEREASEALLSLSPMSSQSRYPTVSTIGELPVHSSVIGSDLNR